MVGLFVVLFLCLNFAGLEGDAAALAEFAGAVEADGVVLNILL